MKTQSQVRITNENVRITEENVQHIGECFALSAIKKMMRFAGHPRSLDKLYAGLVEDIYGNRGYNTTFSDGYDLASEVICFLCHYIGHNLDDMACQNRKGELLTVRFACYRHALRYIEKEYLSPYKTVSIEECSPADASIDYETQYEIEDYTKVDTIIHQMRLTVAEEETLNYYMAGLGFVAIAQMQNVNNTTVWRRRKSMEYMARHHDDLLKTLNDEQKTIFEKFDDCWSEYSSYAEEAIFEYAFRLGAKLTMKIHKDEE